MALERHQIFEGIDLVQLAGMDQRHENVADLGPASRFVEEGITTVQDGHLEASFDRVIVQWSPWNGEETGQRRPALEHVIDGLAERPFRVGDVLDVGGQKGIVNSIGLRASVVSGSPSTAAHEARQAQDPSVGSYRVSL